MFPGTPGAHIMINPPKEPQPAPEPKEPKAAEEAPPAKPPTG